MACSTRSTASVWLIGKPNGDLYCSRLPSKGEVLSKFLFHHMEEKLPINKSLKLTIMDVLKYWNKARIPTQREDNAQRKLNKLFNEYVKLKKARTIQKESCRMNEDIFKGDLTELFDIAAANALETMTCEEDKAFLQLQREDLLNASFGSKDTILTALEERKRKRCEAELARKKKSDVETQGCHKVITMKDVNTEIIDSSSCSESISEDEKDFEPPKLPSTQSRPSTAAISKGKRKKLLTKEVVMSLDRVNISDRKAMYIIAATSKALGQNLEKTVLSRSSVRLSRRSCREVITTDDKASFSNSMKDPFLLHWDGKLLPNIVDGKDKVDRIAILISSGGIEKLLAVPMIPKGTGKAQADVCLKTLDEWGLKSKLRGMVLDTTASNTGLTSGAATLIEKACSRPLLWVACRHHVYEVVLADVFKFLFGASSGPNVPLFKRFRTQWPFIDQTKFAGASHNIFSNVLGNQLTEMIDFYTNAIKKDQFPRDDYAELIHLCILFLGGNPDRHINIRAPGALNNARWMAKAIYSLKIYLFRDQMGLTRREHEGLQNICMFVTVVYAKYWHEAPLPTKAPRNDRAFLEALTKFPNQHVANVAVKAFKRHLWYFAEELVGLAFFDEGLDDEMKGKMKNNLKRTAASKGLKRLDGKSFVVTNTLETYVTEKTANIFDVLMDNGKSMAVESFLQKEPNQWPEDPTYKMLKNKAEQMKVVNDCAERGIALIQQYNQTLTKDETQKQYLLRLVDLHRKAYTEPSKSALA